MTSWIGTSGFQYPEWKGSFYPQDLSARRMLPYYSEIFSSTEINYSFRRIPSEKTLTNWASATQSEFKLSFKAPQTITHFKRLHDCQEILNFFSEAISKLNRKLGAVLFQLPPDFHKDSERLHAFLKIMPTTINASFEFRHASWFEDEIFSMLRDHNAALCIAESETLSTPAIATADFGYLRLRREDYSKTQIEKWSEFSRTQNRRWKNVYIYFKHEERAIGPKFARQMLDAITD